MPTGSVKVMRSYDYCHFEVCLGSDEEMTLDEVNELRKQAAILVDEAVRQYKDAKEAEQRRNAGQWDRDQALARLKRLRETPQSELSVQAAAELRTLEDKEFWRQYEEDDYCYDEDSEREFHFSMLRKFKESRISAATVDQGDQPSIDHSPHFPI